jgi:hypothetical protein
MPQAVGTASGADSMSEAHAGRYYLRHVCASNDAVDHFYQRIWHGRKWIRRAEIRRRLTEIRKVSRRLGHAEHRFAAALYNPPAPWPSEIRRPVNRMAGKTARTATVAFRMGSAANAQAWMNSYTRFRKAYRSANTTSERIRAILDLPPAGEGC